MLRMATILNSISTWICEVTNERFVVEISDSLANVVMVQAAATLPVFLLTIPAGALSDFLDRRKLLNGAQIYLGASGATLTFREIAHRMTVAVYVYPIFLGRARLTPADPTRPSIVPKLVPKGELRKAAALNSIGFNILWAIGSGVDESFLLLQMSQ